MHPPGFSSSTWSFSATRQRRQHVERAGQWTADIHRREDLEHHGWRFVIVTAPDVYRTPSRTLDRVTRAMADQSMPLPRRLDKRWRRYFPTREVVRCSA